MMIANKIPDWSMAPNWANWVCMDGDRKTWNWFEFEPDYVSNKWMQGLEKGKYAACNEFINKDNVILREPWNSLQHKPI
ncbi:MAG: hypothetical protein QMB51_03090 [Patescibacteria group bacterium]